MHVGPYTLMPSIKIWLSKENAKHIIKTKASLNFKVGKWPCKLQPPHKDTNVNIAAAPSHQSLALLKSTKGFEE